MKVIQARNVQKALPRAMQMMAGFGEWEDTRNGSALTLREPVTTVLERPWERVIHWSARRANPFFHLFEALWMLAGRRDVAWPALFVPRMRQYSDDGATLHGAYGHRWRRHFPRDQLQAAVNQLWRDPRSRRVVIAMWDPAVDLGRDGVDLPCNTHIYLSTRGATRLDMTVLCRSNDLIWGLLGANAAHFSILQEWLAAMLGLPMGTLTTVSNDLHAYRDTWEQVQPVLHAYQAGLETDSYEAGTRIPTSLFPTRRAAEEALTDIPRFLDAPMIRDGLSEGSFLWRVAVPMYQAWASRDPSPLQESCLQLEDWALEGATWLARLRKGGGRAV